ncbi:MAG: AAA family ATPase [Nocardioidaceae bacterium]
MSRSGPPSARHLVGRKHEQHLLAEALQKAARGEPGAVVVLGEAGAGKTRLVRDVVSTEAEVLEAQVLWGTCVQFGASTLPFAPLITALREALPQTGVGSEPVRLLPIIDSVVNELARHGPTFLVLDDLQWADVSSLDVLAYLIAGFREQPLAIVATCREEFRPAGHPLYGWLADMRRMPSFSEIVLPRLDLDGTAELLAEVRGEGNELELAAQVHARSDGNPYLTELLGRELPPGAHAVPSSAPGLLTEALTATWHRLDPAAREVMRILAVGGRPTDLPVLTAVARRQGIAVADIGPALTSAQVEGVLGPVDEGRHWFRHPLLAEVLIDGIPVDQATSVHADFADVLASRSSSAPADLATHYERSGNLDRAFEYSLAAAFSAGAVHALAEQAQHLVRACALWPQLSTTRRGSAVERVDLLMQAAAVARLVWRYDDAQRLLEEARGLVDPEPYPLLCSRLLSEWCQVTWERSAPSVALVPELYEAVRLTDGFPDSEERVMALCGLAESCMWDGDLDSARRHADEALEVARRAGPDTVLMRALYTWAAAHDSQDDEALRRVREGLHLARATNDVDAMVEGTIWLVNVLDDRLCVAEAAEAGRLAFDESQRLGGVHWSYFVAAMAANDLLVLGRFEEARDLLRRALAIRCVGVPGAATRLVATRLALRTGDLDGARQHVERALEVAEPGFGGLVTCLIGTVAELLLAEGDPSAALAWIEQRVDGRRGEDVSTVALLWAARALADVAATARDTDDAAGERGAIRAVGEWEARLVPGGISGGGIRNVLTRAEIARCRGDSDEKDHWLRAVDVCRELGFRWEEGCALVLLIDASVRRRAPRATLAPLVRRLHQHAADMGARPMLERSEQLARASRVVLTEPPAVPEQRPGAAGRRPPHESLTDREREVLGHLVVGRTNAEIARELVISDKTVSVHVTNILRKTGTSSRAEVASWAVRLT